MMLELTPQQSVALRSAEGPICVYDPYTKRNYVLVREETMTSLQKLFNDVPLSASERDIILRGIWLRADWDDPAMDEYSLCVSVPPRSLR